MFVVSKGSSHHDAYSTATAIMKDEGPDKTVVVVWDVMRRNKNLKLCRLIGANKGLATFHSSILECGNNNDDVVGIVCFWFSGYGDSKIRLIDHLLTPDCIASPPRIPAYVCRPVGNHWWRRRPRRQAKGATGSMYRRRKKQRRQQRRRGNRAGWRRG